MKGNKSISNKSSKY